MNAQDSYRVSGSRILKNGTVREWRGVDAMHTFGGDSGDMKPWGIDIVREFIGHFKRNPISGRNAFNDNGIWLHSLRKIVDDNRSNGKATVLCP